MGAAADNALATILVLLATTHAILAAVADQQRPPITLAGCPDKCGNISIPFQFGMKPGCFLEGFEVTCNRSFNLPRAFLANHSIYHRAADLSYRTWNYSDSATAKRPDVTNTSVAPAELVDISASKSELRAYGAIRFSTDCLVNGTAGSDRHSVKLQFTALGEFGGPFSPFLLSPLRNALVGVGWNVQPEMVFRKPTKDMTSYLISCLSYVTYNIMTNGSCSGRGCCQASFPPGSSVGFSI